MKTSYTNQETSGHGRFHGWFRGVSCILAGLVLSSGQVWATEQTVVPQNARVMTGVELYTLYRDKSWRWADGAGLMQDDGRTFKAVAGSGASTTWAEGRWIVTDSGKLCFKAAWHTQAGTFPDKTCFSHKTHDGTVYQKKEPSGDWYVFKNAEPTDDDEFNKLVREDLVSAELEAMQDPPQDKHVQ
ncbi:hypothetical protein ATN84_16875 [Paramesorhizobium deserti]|uniref:DUF995 domain-containing protein n=1 Tax=Paramesorhizobium deserti TaxID=1494590 RepID=A0A135HR47_9HYPH|nr:DUF995 domain-containing protein [Paramesorhizobium deserti]KXF75662.1 hypothetical protein ATN84_16875 [Paramesorhizobium deserti]